MSSREDHRLVLVDAKTRDTGERSNERESRIDVCNVVGSDSKIISESKALNVGEAREGVEKRLKGQDKEERGEGATLLDTPLNIYRGTSGAAEKGRDADVSQGPTNKKPEPRRKTNTFKDKVDPSVVNRVESFGRIE